LFISLALLGVQTSAFSSPVFAKTAVGKASKKVAVSKAVKKKAPVKKGAPKKINVKESSGDGGSLLAGGPIGVAGKAMGLLSPVFQFQAKVQAGILVFLVDIVGAPFRVYPKEIRQETTKRTQGGVPILYTYGLSPFSAAAKSILETYDVEVEELGPEWFVLGPGGAEKRIALSELTPNEQTSLPHLFLRGEHLGGLSTGGRNDAGIVGLQESGELDKLLKKKRVTSKRK